MAVRRRIGIVIMIAGVVLVAASAFLLWHNNAEDEGAGQTAASTLAQIKQDTPQTGSSVDDDATIRIDGNDYIGFLSLPTLGLELPVMSDWSYDKLEIALCRQFGSATTDDLVIAGHNYRSFFGHLSSLGVGDGVVLTLASGTRIVYTVKEVRTLDPTAVDEVEHSGFDLVLYTCTYGGRTRVTVFCDRATTS